MRTLFITTKNIDYIRNTQEIRLLREQGREVKLLYSARRNYPLRLMELYIRLLFLPVKGYDEVFIGFEPQLILPLFWWKFRRKPVYIDFFISVYDTFVNDRRRFGPGSPLAKLCRFVDRRTFRLANVIVVDTAADKSYFCEEFGGGGEDVRVLYLDADTEIYYPRTVDRPERLAGRFVVLYFGSVLPLQGVDVILKALELLRDREDLYFYMIGPLGKKLEPIRSENIEYIDWLPQEELAKYIGYADLCLAGHFNGEIGKAKRTIPGKAYIYQAMEKIMILGDGPANRERFTEENGSAFFVPMGDARALADKIVEIKDAVWTGQR